MLHTSDKKQKVEQVEQELLCLEKECQKRYYEMGKNMLDIAHKEGASVNELTEAIIQKKRTLMELREEKLCPSCLLYSSKESLYCKHCGKSFL